MFVFSQTEPSVGDIWAFKVMMSHFEKNYYKILKSCRNVFYGNQNTICDIIKRTIKAKKI